MTQLQRRHVKTMFTMSDITLQNYFQEYTDVVNERLLEEIKRVIDGSKVISDLAVVNELQHTNTKQEIARELLDINRHILAQIINSIEQLIDNLSINCSSCAVDKNDIRAIIHLEYRSYIRNLNGLISLFNLNHRILIESIEQNVIEGTDFVSAQFEQHYKQVLEMIDQNDML